MKKILLSVFATFMLVGATAFAEDVSSPESQCKDKKDQYDKCLEAAKKKADERTLICQPGDFKCLSLKWEKLRKANRTNTRAIDGVKREVGGFGQKIADANRTANDAEDKATKALDAANDAAARANQANTTAGTAADAATKALNFSEDAKAKAGVANSKANTAMIVGIVGGVVGTVALGVGIYAVTHPPTYYQNAMPR